ncbi:MAG: hypothetical protein HYS89_01215 [Candidatus Colwellbacteria bacterium]|nr:hypothetical protein [Candidatus Colwellbacteria bacterium]
MEETKLIKKLKILKSIEPDSGYARLSRALILNQKERTLFIPAWGRKAFSRSLNSVFSVALATVFFMVLALGGLVGAFKNLLFPSLPGIDNQSLVTEADAVTQNIDTRLGEIQYFSGEEVAMKPAEEPKTKPSPAEPGTVKPVSDEEEVDALLDKVISY